MSAFFRAVPSDRNPAVPWRPGELWSLGGIMEQLDASGLVKAVVGLKSAGDTFRHSTRLEVPEQNYRMLVDQIATAVKETTRLSFDVALVSANELSQVINKEATEGGQPNHKAFEGLALQRFVHYSTELCGRVIDGLRARIVLFIEPKYEQLFRQKDPLFGPDVFGAFESAKDDIVEAGKCLSLDRGTATVMHLMRVLEAGLRALASAVGVTKGNDWGTWIRNINAEMETRMKAAGTRTPDETFYSEANTCFDNLKRAFRNPTMHPDRDYSVQRAEEIFEAVKSFMRHLATRLHE